MENPAAFDSALDTHLEAARTASDTDARGKAWSVLVVAHDPRLKQQLVQALAAMIEVGSVRGAHALETGLVAIDGGLVDLLLADLDLPDNGGLTLMRHAQRRLPACKVLALAAPPTAQAHMPAAEQLGALGWLQTQDLAAPQALAGVPARIRQLLAA